MPAGLFWGIAGGVDRRHLSYAKPSNFWRNFRSTRSDEDVSLIVV